MLTQPLPIKCIGGSAGLAGVLPGADRSIYASDQDACHDFDATLTQSTDSCTTCVLMLLHCGLCLSYLCCRGSVPGAVDDAGLEPHAAAACGLQKQRQQWAGAQHICGRSCCMQHSTPMCCLPPNSLTSDTTLKHHSQQRCAEWNCDIVLCHACMTVRCACRCTVTLCWLSMTA